MASYRDVMGLSVHGDRAVLNFDGAWLEVGSLQLQLLDKPVPGAVGQHFAVQVDDIDAAVAELREQAVTVSDPVAVNRNHEVFLNDPSGNMVELRQLGAAGAV